MQLLSYLSDKSCLLYSGFYILTLDIVVYINSSYVNIFKEGLYKTVWLLF